MNKIHLIGLSLAITGLVVGCGSSDIEDTSTQAPLKTIATTEDAKEAGAALLQVNSMGDEYGSSLVTASSYSPNLAPSVFHKEHNCISGTMEVTGSYEDDGSYADFTQNYNACNLGGFEADGTMKFLEKINNDNINIDISANNLLYKYSDMSVKMDLDMHVDGSKNFDPLNMNLDGSINISYSGYSFNTDYDNFLVNRSGDYVKVSGTVSVDSDVLSCYNGRYEIETVDDLYLDATGYASGTLKVNGATYTYNNDTVDVTFANGSTTTLSQSDLVDKVVCN
jgi:hypothetical protein